MSKLVVKLGGSFLTKKDLSDLFPKTIQGIQKDAQRFMRMDNLLSAVSEIQGISERHDLMIVHGAGPFGHALVHGIETGETIDPMDVHASMLVLNEALVQRLASVGLQALTSSPLDFVEFDGTYHTERLVSKMMSDRESGVLPVSHGDIVPANLVTGRLGRFAVISGDVVSSDVSLGWGADRIIMVTDVDGILDRDPNMGPGKRIPRITYRECVELLKSRGGRGADVTGGILGKIIACRGPISKGIPLQVVSGTRAGDLEAASDGGDAGTLIEAG